MLKLFCLLFVAIFLVQSTVSANERHLSFDPPGQEKNRSIYLAKSGDERFVVACHYSGDDANGPHAIQWINENGEVISSSTSVAVLSNSQRNEKKLIFTSIKKHDTGEYKCRVQLESGGFVERNIFIKVINNIRWNTPGNVVGGILDEPLTIDCGAKGEPEPTIEIADVNGQSVEDFGYTVINNQVTIPKLTKAHNGLVFKCLAVQKVNMVDQFNTTTADEHKLIVDVYYRPEFEMLEVETFTATGKNISLTCLVMASNPRVERFDFYRNTQIIFNHDRYEVSTNIVNQMATLRITTVEDDDYGRYRCIAKNGKLSGEQILILKKTAPPKPPFVEIADVFNNSVVLRVTENREVDDLPVLSYSMSYVPKSNTGIQLALLGDDDNESGETLPKVMERRSTNFYRNTNNSYEVKGLEANVHYEFLVRPMNEVGEGDPVMLDVLTGSRSNEYLLSAGSSSLHGGISVIMGSIIMFVVAILSNIF